MSGDRRAGLGLPGVGTRAHNERIGNRDNWICGICGMPVNPELSVYETEWAATIDHIIPRCKGGSNEDDNLQIAHLACNVRKGRYKTVELYEIHKLRNQYIACHPEMLDLGMEDIFTCPMCGHTESAIYAATETPDGAIRMENMILGTDALIHHANRDSLDNRRSNLYRCPTGISVAGLKLLTKSKTESVALS